ncbi:MAG: hypothetical protein IKY87_01860, partial [Paludibacteraceae bacterium]|nr:hypothetical protein [Paludibacteraceae bacterium]
DLCKYDYVNYADVDGLNYPVIAKPIFAGSISDWNNLTNAEKSWYFAPDTQIPEYLKDISFSLGSMGFYRLNGAKYEVGVGSTQLLLTDFGYNLLSLIFKLFKPFVGEGSYLDLLNMNRMVLEDYIYVFMKGIRARYLIATPYNAHECSYFDVAYVSDKPMKALNLRVLYLIWYNNYRDQLLEKDALKPRKDDTISDAEMVILTIPRHRCWEKDSYTTALDNPATADAVVPMLSQRTVDVAYQNMEGVGTVEADRANMDIYQVRFSDGTTFDIPTNFLSGMSPRDGTNIDVANQYFSLHVLDAVKRAQKFLRKALFYGNRIQDFIYTTWGVKHLDARLRLPEILSSSVDMAEISTLVNNTTVVTDLSSTVAGDRSGLAKGYDKGNYFERYCEESGVIMSIFCIIPQPTYAYGSDRQYYKLDRYDYPIPDFATLGMDAIYDSELVSLPTKVWNDNFELVSDPLIFGYQGRYYDSKFRQSTEHGEFLTTQDMYTFGRRWNMYDPDGRPKLNYEFVHCFPPLHMFVMEDRTEDYWRANIHHETMAELTLPYHSIYL